MSPRRNLKNHGKMAQESGRTEQSGYQFKNTEHPLAKIVVNHLCPVEQQVEK
jgi:hypothetical protein